MSVKVEIEQYERDVRVLLKILGEDQEKFIKQQSGLLARDLAKYTPPWSGFPQAGANTVGTAQDIKAGRKAIEWDLKRICTIVSPNAAKWAYEQFRDAPIFYKDKQWGHGVITSVVQFRAFHRGRKNWRGRTLWLPEQDRPWVSKHTYNAYYRDIKIDVGVAKAGFVKASKALQAKGAVHQEILNDLRKASGSGRVVETTQGATGLIGAKADGIAWTHKHSDRALKERLKKSLKRLEFMWDRMVERSGFF